MADVDLTGLTERLVPVDYGERSMGNWVAMEFFYTDFVTTGDSVNCLTIPANSFVPNVYLVIEEAFYGSGSTISLTVGDDNDAEGYLEETDIGAATTGNVVNTVPDSNADAIVAEYRQLTKLPFYTSADTLDVLCNFSAAMTAGKITLIAQIVTVPR